MNESFAETFLRASRPVRYAATVALGALALFLLAIAITAWNNVGKSENPYMNTITVEGTGTGTAIPNLAVVSFSVSENAATVAAAQNAATEKTNAALTAVEDLGVEEKDVKTIAYNVYPQYENTYCTNGYCPDVRSPKIIGYEVSQTVEVKVRDTAKAGDVLQALGTLNVQNISGPSFQVDEEDEIKNVAREEAITEAKAKAKALADQLGVRLGKVVSFYENPGYMPYYGYDAKGGTMMEAAQSAPAPSLPTGEQETVVSVSITYEIK
jgi:uncharacterized protein